MTIPDYQTAMLPLLQSLSDDKPHRLADLIDHLADHFRLTPEERAQLLPSGRTLVFYSRLQWAKTYMTQAGLLAPVSRGIFCITDAGRLALAESPPRIDVRFLGRYAAFQDFVRRSGRGV